MKIPLDPAPSLIGGFDDAGTRLLELDGQRQLAMSTATRVLAKAAGGSRATITHC